LGFLSVVSPHNILNASERALVSVYWIGWSFNLSSIDFSFFSLSLFSSCNSSVDGVG